MSYQSVTISIDGQPICVKVRILQPQPQRWLAVDTKPELKDIGDPEEVAQLIMQAFSLELAAALHVTPEQLTLGEVFDFIFQVEIKGE